MGQVEEVVGWLDERRINCLRIAGQKIGEDRAGWLEDARQFHAAIEALAALTRERDALAAPLSDAEWLDLCSGDHVDVAEDIQRRDIDLLLANRREA